MDIKLYKGRPTDTDGRLEKEIKVYDLLDRTGIDYWRTDHEAVNTIDEGRDIDAVLDAEICKNLFLCNRQKTNFYLLMMPGDKKLDTKQLSHQLGVARLTFADAENMLKYLDITPGSVSVMGLMNDTENKVQLIVDRSIFESEFVGCHPCINTTSLKLRTSDLFNIVLPLMNHDMIIVDI